MAQLDEIKALEVSVLADINKMRLEIEDKLRHMMSLIERARQTSDASPDEMDEIYDIMDNIVSIDTFLGKFS